MKLRQYTFLILTLIFLSISVSAEDKWLYGHSDNFYFLSNADKSQTRKTILEYETFRAGFLRLHPQYGQVKLHRVFVYIFKSTKSFVKFAPLKDGKPSESLGTFFHDEEQPLIAMRLNAPPGYREKIVYHEYIHFLSLLDQDNRPLWWIEGIAELYSTVELKSDKLEFGGWDENHVRRLQSEVLIPLEDFFAADRQYIQKRNRIYRFYAQSWAFLHYCLLGEGRKYGDSFIEFVERLGLGAEIDPAFKASFQVDYKKLERDLKKHILGGRAYISTLALKDIKVGEIQEMSTPSPAQLDFALGNLLYHSHRIDDALPYLNRALLATTL